MGATRTMENRQQNKAHSLDLSRKRAELESIFDSVISKIPDLCLPATYRWAGENDYFNQTSTIKLVPYRKQQMVERCLSVELSSPTPSLPAEKVLIVGASKKKPTSSCISKKKSDSGNISGSSGKLSVKDKYEMRRKINQHYTRLARTPKRNKPQDTWFGYDRLFSKKAPDDYPFSNPMPAAMLTEENIDNLRDTIVSTREIEWKMLTPARPESQYEEGFFDKLVQLHRFRYGSRLESGLYTVEYQRSPFKHTRHSYMMNLNLHHNIHSPMSLGLRLKQKFSRERIKSIVGHNFRLTIPTLTLTSAETGSELIDDFEDSPEQPMELIDLSYAAFSRFSKANSLDSVKNKPVPSGDLLKSVDTSWQNDPEEASGSIGSASDALDEQVEGIISHLMSSNL